MQKWLEQVKEVVTLPNLLAGAGAAFGFMYFTKGGVMQLIPNVAGTPWGYVDDAIAAALTVLLGVSVIKRVMAKRK